MKRKLVAGAFAFVVALACGTFLLNESAGAAAPGGAGAGGPPAGAMGGGPGGPGGAGARGGMGGAMGARGGAMGGRGGGAMGGMGGRGAPPGPPATVPAEVAIPRPTAEEVAKINADIQKFIETSPHKELMKKYASLLTVQMPRDNTAIRPTGGGRGGQAASTDFDIMLLGDSITSLLTVADDGGGNPGGKTVMEKYLPDMKYVNMGVPGDSTQGVLGRLNGGIGQGHKPKAVMLLIGTNNNSNTAEEIAEGVGADVWELRRDFPEAKILLMGIFPRGASPSDSGRIKMAQVNKIIAKLADDKNVFFMDLTPKMLAPDGKLIGFRPTDNLHPVVEGFDIWISNAAPLLKSWVK